MTTTADRWAAIADAAKADADARPDDWTPPHVATMAPESVRALFYGEPPPPIPAEPPDPLTARVQALEAKLDRLIAHIVRGAR